MLSDEKPATFVNPYKKSFLKHNSTSLQLMTFIPALTNTYWDFMYLVMFSPIMPVGVLWQWDSRLAWCSPAGQWRWRACAPVLAAPPSGAGTPLDAPAASSSSRPSAHDAPLLNAGSVGAAGDAGDAWPPQNCDTHTHTHTQVYHEHLCYFATLVKEQLLQSHPQLIFPFSYYFQHL